MKGSWRTAEGWRYAAVLMSLKKAQETLLEKVQSTWSRKAQNFGNGSTIRWSPKTIAVEESQPEPRRQSLCAVDNTNKDRQNTVSKVLFLPSPNYFLLKLEFSIFQLLPKSYSNINFFKHNIFLLISWEFHTMHPITLFSCWYFDCVLSLTHTHTPKQKQKQKACLDL